MLFGPAGRISSRYNLWGVQGGTLLGRAGAFFAVAGLAAIGTELLAAPGATPSLVLGLLLAVVGVTWAFVAVAGTSIVTRGAPANTRGAFLGAYAAVAAGASAVGSLLGGGLVALSYSLAFGVAGVLVMIGGGLVFLSRQFPGVTGPGS
ncbi:MAG: hypothetical protein ABEJ35_01660 [Halobacteriaceae archaeon]